MKAIKNTMLSAAFATVLTLNRAAAQSDQLRVSISPDATPPPASAPAQSDAANNAEFPDGHGLLLNFRKTPLVDVLTYMSRAAGFIIYLRPGVNVDGAVDAWSEQPLSKVEAIDFLKTVLSDHGYSVLQNDRVLTILNTRDMPTQTDIKLGANPELIPKNAEVVTQIIPMRNLNVAEVSGILARLLPGGASLAVNQSANALLVTDTQANIRRAAEIIAALDSVSSTVNTLRVYPLQYADAKTVSGLVKDLFAPPDTARNGGNGAGNVINFPGARGLGAARGFNANVGADAAAGQAPVSRVTATADEHGNAVIVSAPEAMLPAIGKLIEAVDIPVDDITELRSFPLKNADPSETADELMNLFPNDNNSSDAGGAQIQFNGRGGRGGQVVGARQGTSGNSSTPDGRMQKLGRVLAVPDPRTQAVMVSASKTLMPQIADLIAGLDADSSGHQRTYVIPIKYADVQDIQRVIQELYSSSGVTATSGNNTDLLAARATAILNAEFANGGMATGFGNSSTSGRSSSTASR